MAEPGITDGLWDAVVGQERAVAALRSAARSPVHAYLFVGPRGSGRRAAARAFAAELLTEGLDTQAAERGARLVADENHPDLIVVERSGASISREQARTVVERTALSPVEGTVKVLVLTEFHLVLDAAPILLKSIEEPPDGTHFVVIADDVPNELVTIASRCVRIDFAPLAPGVVVQRLVDEGVEAEMATSVAAASGGDLQRARLLLTDDGLAERVAVWRDVPGRLDGTGSTATVLVDELIAQIDLAQKPLDLAQSDEAEELAERIEAYGERGSGKRLLDERHKRERRRLRADEVRFGLGLLAEAYRDRLVNGDGASAGRALAALDALAAANDGIERNAGERLLLVWSLTRLHPLG